MNYSWMELFELYCNRVSECCLTRLLQIPLKDRTPT